MQAQNNPAKDPQASVLVRLAVQRTNRGWMQQPGARDQAQGDQRNYALGRVIEVVEPGTFYEKDASKALDLLFGDTLTPAQKAEFDPFTVEGLIKEDAARLRSEGQEAQADEMLSYLEPRPVSLIGSTVRVSSLPMEPAAFELGGFQMEGVQSGRGGGRRSTLTFSLEKGLNYLFKTFDVASVIITARVHPLVNSRKLLGTAQGQVQSIIFNLKGYEKVEVAVGMSTTAALSAKEVAFQQAAARAERVKTLQSMSLGSGGRVGLVSTNLQIPGPTQQTAEPPAKQAEPTTEDTAMKDPELPQDPSGAPGGDTSIME